MEENIKSDDPVISVLIEFRRLVQSVNVFIRVARKCQEVNVVLHQNCIEITIEGSTQKITCKNFDILVDSLSNLQKFERYITFRLSTSSNDNCGSFKTEFLKLDDGCSVRAKSKTFLMENENYTFKCGNCDNEFCNDVKFKRVLPLPSDSASIHEWFCHADPNKTTPNLNPNEDDIFFSQCYAHIHKALLQEVENIQNIICCKKCKKSIGTLVDSCATKFWFHSIYISSNSRTFKSDPLSDVVETIFSSVNMDGLVSAIRLILVANQDNADKFLILHIIEKKLCIQIIEGDHRETSNMAKVLYKVFEENAPEIKIWRQTFGVGDIAVSCEMMFALTNHLSAMEKYIPVEFSQANGFNISYIPVPLIE